MSRWFSFFFLLSNVTTYAAPLVVPLTRSPEGFYVAQLAVLGMPSRLLVDTGSRDLWVPQKSSPIQAQAARISGMNTGRRFHVTYGSASASGTMNAGALTVQGADPVACEFGVATEVSGLLTELQSLDGIWGLAPGPSTDNLVSCLQKEGRISETAFTLSLNEHGGTLSLGEATKSKVRLVSVGVGDSWTVQLNGVTVNLGEKSYVAQTTVQHAYAVLDCGSSGIRGPATAIHELATTLDSKDVDGALSISCDESTSKANLEIKLAGEAGVQTGELIVRIPVSELIDRSKEKKGWCPLRLYKTSSLEGDNTWILGGAFFRKMKFVSFNYDDRVVGVAPDTSDAQWVVAGSVESGEVHTRSSPAPSGPESASPGSSAGHEAVSSQTVKQAPSSTQDTVSSVDVSQKKRQLQQQLKRQLEAREQAVEAQGKAAAAEQKLHFNLQGHQNDTSVGATGKLESPASSPGAFDDPAEHGTLTLPGNVGKENILSNCSDWTSLGTSVKEEVQEAARKTSKRKELIGSPPREISVKNNTENLRLPNNMPVENTNDNSLPMNQKSEVSTENSSVFNGFRANSFEILNSHANDAPSSSTLPKVTGAVIASAATDHKSDMVIGSTFVKGADVNVFPTPLDDDSEVVPGSTFHRKKGINVDSMKEDVPPAAVIAKPTVAPSAKTTTAMKTTKAPFALPRWKPDVDTGDLTTTTTSTEPPSVEKEHEHAGNKAFSGGHGSSGKASASSSNSDVQNEMTKKSSVLKARKFERLFGVDNSAGHDEDEFGSKAASRSVGHEEEDLGGFRAADTSGSSARHDNIFEDAEADEPVQARKLKPTPLPVSRTTAHFTESVSENGKGDEPIQIAKPRSLKLQPAPLPMSGTTAHFPELVWASEASPLRMNLHSKEADDDRSAGAKNFKTPSPAFHSATPLNAKVTSILPGSNAQNAQSDDRTTSPMEAKMPDRHFHKMFGIADETPDVFPSGVPDASLTNPSGSASQSDFEKKATSISATINMPSVQSTTSTHGEFDTTETNSAPSTSKSPGIMQDLDPLGSAAGVIAAAVAPLRNGVVHEAPQSIWSNSKGPGSNPFRAATETPRPERSITEVHDPIEVAAENDMTTTNPLRDDVDRSVQSSASKLQEVDTLGSAAGIIAAAARPLSSGWHAEIMSDAVAKDAVTISEKDRDEARSPSTTALPTGGGQSLSTDNDSDHDSEDYQASDPREVDVDTSKHRFRKAFGTGALHWSQR